jgi:predicted nucleotidyltransferase
MLLERLAKEFQKSGIDYAIVGGVALALHGAPRGTIDVDLVIRHAEKDFIDIEAALKRMGFLSRIPVTAKEVFQFREEYIKRRNLNAWSFYNPLDPFEVIDVVLTHDLKSMKSISKKLGLSQIRVISLLDLIEMKQKAGRPQDLEDLKILRKLNK